MQPLTPVVGVGSVRAQGSLDGHWMSPERVNICRLRGPSVQGQLLTGDAGAAGCDSLGV